MLTPKLPSFFKTLRPKAFEYKPRYYDAQKEYIDRYKEQINPGSSKIDAPARAKQRIQDKYNRFRSEGSVQFSGKSRSKRIVVLVLVLGLIAYFLIKLSAILDGL